MSRADQPDQSAEHLLQRIDRLEELLMFADHRHESIFKTVEELSRQVASQHKAIDQLTKRLKDAERASASGEQPRTPEDEVPPHNAF